MPRHHGKTGPDAPMLLLAVASFLVMVSAVSGLTQQITMFGPAVGDIIRFDPARIGVEASEVKLTVERQDRTVCTMDLSLIGHGGGSIILERFEPGAALPWHGHWAGPRTSGDAMDCGTSADLALSSINITFLSAGAGGYWAGDSRGTENSIQSGDRAWRRGS